MIRWSLSALALLCAVRAEPVEARPQNTPPATRPSTSSERSAGEAADEVARRFGLAGELLVAKGDRILLDRGYGTISPSGGVPHKAGERWRLASITKQVTAALIVREHPGDLDRPWNAITRTSGEGFPTLRQLLTHHSGLGNPDSTPAGADGVPSFYKGSTPETLAICGKRVGLPGGAFSYNNCDYITARAVLGFVQGQPENFWPADLTMARAGEMGVPGYVRGKPEPRFELSSWDAAGGLVGTAPAVFAFDRALMTGKLLSPAALKTLWTPEGNGSYQALGQWVFPGKLKGCAAPKRIVQRDGEIYGVQARNFILPDDDLVVIVYTNRSADDLALGEVWEGKGFVYDLLSAVACS